MWGSSRGPDGTWCEGPAGWGEGLLPPVIFLACARGRRVYKQWKMLLNYAIKNSYCSKSSSWGRIWLLHVSVLPCESLRAADTAKREDNQRLSHVRPEGIFVDVFSIVIITPVARKRGYQEPRKSRACSPVLCGWGFMLCWKDRLLIWGRRQWLGSCLRYQVGSGPRSRS